MIPLQYRLLGVLALVVAAVFAYRGFVDHEQGIGYRRAVAEYAIKLEEANDAARQREHELTQQRDEAINHATERDQKIRDLAVDAGHTADRLRDAITAARRSVPVQSCPAAAVTVDTFATLFDECQARYRELGEKADRHANDVKTLIDAWPSR